ncbi:hypothetical protein NBE98_16730 [Clostridium swellfunianum]|uniref:hypothetical protein n=1 Tax=Clostridium swellfunianum TaxID=1367462 RepID=UPI00202ED5D9|nr:hypothetical protein [Clostridium swellfunianum]MCM0650016.1 hypothetical protein [Clostridium swellfunianum]
MTKLKNTEDLDLYEEEDNGFTEGDVKTGIPIMTFSFAPDPAQVPQPAQASFGRMSFNPSQRGSTPAVDGEEFTHSRTYKLRPSTVRKLNELKAAHSDVNAYLNTIVDEAITYYYEHNFSRRTKS